MKISLSWLHELTGVDDSAPALAERLTAAGMEVEEISDAGITADEMVAARVTDVRPHPNADRLRICRVSDGAGDHTVVCGADNVQPGIMAALARPGAVTAGGQVIRAAEIRGEPSAGMLCAPDELGIDNDHRGILLLPDDTVPGTPLTGIIGPPDKILTIEVTPNRPDCLSMIGMARETAAIYGLRLRRPAATGGRIKPVEDDIRATLEDAADCPRYIIRRFRAIKLGPAPIWMRRRLFQAGIRPINNVVDITNYVMLECGQPLHAFDCRRLHGQHIYVRRARPGETLATLDGIRRELTPEMLVIADVQGPVALAGVMGGADTGVTDDTAHIALESACFAAPVIRRAGRLLGMHSESAFRFERGVDPLTTDWAVRRAGCLLRGLAGARADGCGADVFPNPPSARSLKCRYERIHRMLGIDVPQRRVMDIFKALELQPRGAGRRACVVTVPAFRRDLEAEADLVEEVARMHGLDAIPTPSDLPGQSDAGRRHRRALDIMRLRAAAVGLGLSEIMNYSFAANKLLDDFDPQGRARRVFLANPISAEHEALRGSLLPQLVDTLGRNRAHQIADAAVFEIGRVFHQPPRGPAAEADRLAMGLMGAPGRPALDRRRPPDDEEAFLWIKGLLANICRAFRAAAPSAAGAAAEGFTLTALESGAGPAERGLGEAAFAPGRGFSVHINGLAAGVIGLVNPALRREWRINEPLAVAEIDIDALLAQAGRTAVLNPPPVYPAVQRDLALRVPQSMPHARILEVIYGAAPKELTKVELFDIFRGAQIGVGYKSMAYCLTYRSEAGTLRDEEVNAMHEHIILKLRQDLQAEVRAG